MKNKIENATVTDLINGFISTERFIDKANLYTCLFCHAQYDADDIYLFKKLLVNGKKAIKMHIREKHGEVFDNLLSTDKELTGLTDTQKDFLKNYYSGMPDKEIAEKMNITQSTVRYQRHNFREKAKQAKIILALAELLAEQEEKLIKLAKPAGENEKMLEAFFESMSPLVLKTFDFGRKKDEKRAVILNIIIKQFEKGKKYTNKEVDEILKNIYGDYATIRRHLVDQGFMERTSDCKEYWVK